MRIAVVHSFYSSQTPSGENSVVLDQVQALSDAGHEVRLIAAQTDDLSKRPLFKLRAASWVLLRKGVEISQELRAFNPEVVHVHNTFPNLGSKWMREWVGKIVYTAHNYRVCCANGSLFRHGNPCFECVAQPSKVTLPILDGCYRGSSLATIPVVLSRAGFRRDIVASQAWIIALSEGSAEILRQVEGMGGRISVVPNFVDDFCIDSKSSVRNDTWIVGARLTVDKGVAELIRIWPKENKLAICGSGPDEERVRLLADCNPNIRLAGTLSREAFRILLASSAGVILPSRWPEVAPQVLVEAACAGKPAMVHESTVISKDVVRAGSGLSYSTAGDLSKGITEISDNYSRFSASARLSYENSFTRGAWLTNIFGVFQKL